MANQKVDGIEVEISLSSGNFTKELKNIENKTEDTAEKMEQELKEANEEIINSFSDMAKGIENALAGALGSVMALAGTIGGMALNSVFEFDSAMSQLQASLGLTNDQMAEFEEVAKNVYGNNYGENWEDVANAVAEANKQLWVQGDELQSVTEKAFTVRDTFGVDVSESIRATKSLMMQFGLTGDESFNLITQGFQHGLDYSGEFLDSINEYSPHFAQIGFSAEEMFNLFYDGAESGAFNLDKIGDAIKELGIRTQDMSDTTREAYKTLGLDVKATEKAFAQGGEAGKKAFDDIIEGIGGIEDPLKRNEVGVQLFGTMWEDLGEDVVMSLNDMSDMFNKTVDSAGELTEIRYDDIGSAFAGIKRQVEVGALIPIGEQLLPLVNEFADWLQNEGIPKIVEFADSFGQKLTEGVQICLPFLQLLGDGIFWVLDNINFIIPALAGLYTAFKGFSVLTAIVGGFQSLSSAIGIAGGLMPWISGLIGAISLPILAVAGALGFLVYAFITDFGNIRTNTMDILNNLKDLFMTWWEAVKSNFGESLEAIKNLVTTVWESIKQYIDAVLQTISGIIKAVTQAMNGDWAGAWETMKNTAKNLMDAMKNIVKNIFNAIVDVVISIGVNLANAMYKAWTQAKDKAKEVWDSLCSWFKGAINDPVGTITSIGSAMYNAGRDMLNSVWNGCKSIWNSISEWFTSKVNWIKDKLTFWKSSQSEMSGGGGGKSSGYSPMSAMAMNSRLAYAVPTSSTSTTNITFSGNYNFSNRGDIDYFMQQAGQQMRRNR